MKTSSLEPDKEFSFAKFSTTLLIILILGYLVLFSGFWLFLGNSRMVTVDNEQTLIILYVDNVLEFLDRFNGMIAFITAGILLAFITKNQIKNTDSWLWLSCGFLSIGIWCFNNVVRSFVKFADLSTTNPLYQFIQLFDHTFELWGAILLAFWLVKLYRIVYKDKEPHPGSLYSFIIVIGGALILHSIIYLILAFTGTLYRVIDGGDWDKILDKLENITIGPLMFILGIFTFIIILRMVERNKAWILTGFGLISYGVDRTFMDLIRSFLEDKIVIPFLNFTIGVSLIGLDPITDETIPPNIIYWFFEFGDHYWTSLTLLLVLGTGMLYQEFSKEYEIKPSYLLLLEEKIAQGKKIPSSLYKKATYEKMAQEKEIPYSLENLLRARDLLTKQVEERTQDLLEQKQQLETIIETIPNAILVLDFTGSLSLANRRFKDLYQMIFQRGLSSDFNIHDQPDHQLFVEVKRFFSSKSENKVQKKVEIQTIEPIKGLYKELHFANISIPEELHYADIAIPGERLGVIIEYRDVTKFIKFDNLRKQFVSTVSHELRTPITAIDLSIKNLQKYSARLTDKQREEFMDTIAQSSSVLNDMIADLLLISRVEAGRFELQPSSFQLQEALNDVLNQLEPKRKAQKLSIQVDLPQKVKLFGDPKRIRQIFRILIDNAIKFSPEKSDIKITAIDNYQGKFNPEKVDGILIQFSDSGIGIKQEDLPQLFERFFRTAEARKTQGTGLGLSIAKELVLLHKGEIFIESEYGKGSTFSVFLPRLAKFEV